MAASAFETNPSPYDRLETPAMPPSAETVLELEQAFAAIDTVTDTAVPGTADVIYRRAAGTLGRAPLPEPPAVEGFLPLDGSEPMTGGLTFDLTSPTTPAILVSEELPSSQDYVPAWITDSSVFPVSDGVRSTMAVFSKFSGVEIDEWGDGSVQAAVFSSYADDPNDTEYVFVKGLVAHAETEIDVEDFSHEVYAMQAVARAQARGDVYGVSATAKSGTTSDSWTTGVYSEAVGGDYAIGGTFRASDFGTEGVGVNGASTNSSGTVIGGKFSSNRNNQVINVYAGNQNADTQFHILTSGPGGSEFGGWVRVTNNDPAVVALFVRRQVAQSANIISINDEADNILSRFNKDGYFVTKLNSAPANGDLAANEMALWFDSTNGAAKLKIKGKSANGTVVAGEVALA